MVFLKLADLTQAMRDPQLIAPLVFLNACQSIQLDASRISPLLDKFVALGASGLVVTEVPVFTSLATSIGEQLLGLVAAGCGAIGDVARFASVKKVPLRHILVGMVAALGAMYFTNPTDALRLIGGALLFGWGGEAVLASLQAKAQVDLAERQAKDAKQEAAEKARKLDRAEADIDIAIVALAQVSQRQQPAAGNSLDLPRGGAGMRTPDVPVTGAVLEILRGHREERRL